MAKAFVDDSLSFELLSCKLFPENYDFRNVCSCEECIPKISYLKGFEGFLISTYRKVLEFMECREHAVEKCFNFVDACNWSDYTLDTFLNSLKQVKNELGEEFIKGQKDLDHKVQTMKLYKCLAESGLFPIYDVPAEEWVNNTTETPKHIAVPSGIYYYKKTKFGEEGENLLNKMLQLEVEHTNAKKLAADNGKKLHPSISKGFLLQQIECLENLPVKGLRIEAEACIAKVSNIIPIEDYLFDAKNSINRTSIIMVDIRKAFWRKIKRKGKGVRGHELTGLSTTLDVLKRKAAAFYAEWENRFAQHIPPPTPQCQEKETNGCSSVGIEEKSLC